MLTNQTCKKKLQNFIRFKMETSFLPEKFEYNIDFDFDFERFICSFINVHLNIIIERT
jgi:hypothetical protein